MKLIRAFGLVIGGVLAVYLVGRGIAEFFTVNYSDPASYRLDWGGPSLAGVFAVHTGPAVLILAGAAVWLRRHWRRTHRLSSAALTGPPGHSPRRRLTTARRSPA